MEQTIEEIKRRLDIIDFIGGYVTLKKTGRNFKANCPFHQEKSASFVVSAERQIWHCFGACGEGGDIIKFLMKWDNITFFEALRELADRAGIKFETTSIEDKEWQNKNKLLSINNLANEYYQYILHKTAFGKKALDYLANRNINSKIINTFNIGYSPSSWDSLLNFLKKRNFTEQQIFEAGLVVRNDSGRYYDRFRGRLMFPIKDIRGNIIGFSGRLLDASVTAAKYVNTPETPLYHKRESLFGIHLTKEAIKKSNCVLLVEGEFDMITPYQHGVENIVAIKGAAVTKEQLVVLKRLTNKIILALDADVAGQEAIKRGIQEAERAEFEIGVVQFEDGKDPDEAIRKNAIGFKKSLNSPIPIYDFVINLALKNHSGSDPFEKSKIGDSVIPFIADIKNPIIQSHYIRKLASILEVSEDSIDKMIKRRWKQLKAPKPFVSRQILEKKEDRGIMLQKYVLSHLFHKGGNNDETDTLTASDFTIPSYQKIFDALTAFKKSQPQFEAKQFALFLSPELRAVFDEIYLYNSLDIDVTADDTQRNELNIQKMIYEMKRYTIKKNISEMLTNESNTNDDKEVTVTKLSQSLIEVEKRLRSL